MLQIYEFYVDVVFYYNEIYVKLICLSFSISFPFCCISYSKFLSTKCFCSLYKLHKLTKILDNL